MKNGFTLVELLAVLAVLAVLAIIGGTSVFGILGKVRQKTLDESLASLKEVGISYIEQKKVYLDSCTSDFNPAYPTAKSENNDCYQSVSLQEIMNAGLFEAGNLKCHPEKRIIVYRVKSGNYTDFKTYLPDNICEI